MRFKLVCTALIPVFIVLDQLSKWAVTEKLLRPLFGEESLPLSTWAINPPPRLDFAALEVLPFFNLVMVWNYGVSFGLMNDGKDSGALMLAALAIAISAAFSVWFYRSISKIQSFALSLVIAGAIGNVIDRLRFGAVVDFLDFHAMGWHYPAFNLADSLIVIGIFALLYHALFLEKQTTTD